MRTAPLAGRDRAAFDALIRSLRVVAQVVETLATTDPEDVDDRETERMVAALEAQQELDGLMRTLAGLLLRQVTGASPVTEAALDAAQAELDQQRLAAEVLAAGSPGLAPEQSNPGPGPGPEPEPAWADDMAIVATGALLREIGLEELDLSAQLLLDAEGQPVLSWEPVPVETAHVWLLGSLYDRVEASLTMASPLLPLEREASRWWFEQWTAPPSRATEDQRFTQSVREQEWSLVERPAISVDAPVITWFCETPEYHQMPPRLQRLARALRRSFASIFAVRSVSGVTAVLEDLVNGREYTVHEHNQPVPYQAGWLGLGRLIPFENARYLRSPGMLLYQPALESLGSESELAQGFAAFAGDFGPAVALEAIITTIVTRVRLPRTVLPAPSRAEARERLAMLMEALNEEELSEPLPAAEAPAELRALASPETSRFYAYSIDRVVAEWAEALSKQAGERAGSARRRSAKPSRKGGRKKGR